MTEPRIENPMAEWLAACCAGPEGISFSRFMESALYHPDWGYYASGRALIGREGDFYTSVSVGPCFGQLLARRVAEWWREAGSPAHWPLVEQGSHDGRLMADVLDALAALGVPSPSVFLVEPFPALRERQERTLSAWVGSVNWTASLCDLPPEAKGGVFLANELLDAFPVERLRWQGGGWVRLNVVVRVAVTGPAFEWRPVPIDSPELAEALRSIPSAERPDGYTTEVRLGLAAWAADLASGAAPRLALLADYGFSADDYFHPARIDGTLACYAGHRHREDALADPGLGDLTAHVDWTAACRALQAAGLEPGTPTDQGRWLTAVAAPHLLALEASGPPDTSTRAWLRQFQTLVHPSHLGLRFQILEAGADRRETRIRG